MGKGNGQKQKASGEVAFGAAATNQERTKGYIFSQLVEKEGDITGYIAYALYKFEKIEHIRTYKRKNHCDIPQEEKDKFYEICCNSERIKGYRQRAAQVFDKFYSTLYKNIHAQARQEVLKEQERHILDVVNKEMPEIVDAVAKRVKANSQSMKEKYLHGILQSMIGAFLTAILVFLLVKVIPVYDWISALLD